jgi:hypothetical protein
MRLRGFELAVLGLVIVIAISGCAGPSTPSVDHAATAVAQAAADLLTATAAAASPTLLPPTVTLTPTATETPTVEPTSSEPPRMPLTVNFASCGLGGPEPQYEHETSIKKGKGVELLGVGSIAGYYVVRDPYFHRPCWVLATDLKIFEGTDLSRYPVMTPGVPAMGQ